jgi:hypothetical protein
LCFVGKQAWQDGGSTPLGTRPLSGKVRALPEARELTITADGGGSNGTRVRLWKVELQKLADETGLVLHVHHYPPGTSKWNKIYSGFVATLVVALVPADGSKWP